MTEARFSHVHKFTGYMKNIAGWFSAMPRGMRILDMPAGAGKMRDALEPYGHQVVCADINEEKKDYIYTDMNKPLPFKDGEFDAVICLEGIEHVIDPVLLIGEIARVTKSNGTIIISTPNITNMYSRLQFLFTGIFYQFNPSANPIVKHGEMKDRGHISPMAYYQLQYLFDFFGADLADVGGDRYKKKILFPIYAVVIAFGWLWSLRLRRKNNPEMSSRLFSPPVLFGRSIILYFRKR